MGHVNINKVIMTGNLTKDAELITSATGNSVLKFSIAVNDYAKNGETKVNYFDVTKFGKGTDGLSKYLGKGTKVAVAGKLSWNKFTDKQGNNRTSVNIIADEVELLTSEKREDGNIIDTTLADMDIPF